MKNTKVSIVIPNYNGKTILESNLPALVRATGNVNNNIKEVIVVDNGSTDGSKELLSDKYPKIKVVRLDKNYGFSLAVNKGVAISKGNLILLLNNDVSPSINFLEPVFKHFDDPQVFGVSLHEKGYYWTEGKLENGFIAYKSGAKSKRSHDTFWVAGSSGVFRKSIWNKLGGLDEELLSPFYWEDIDLGYRASKRGYKLVWEPRANVVHKHASTASTQISRGYLQRIQERNQLLFIWKNLTSARMMRKHYSGLARRILRNPGYLRIFVMALWKMPTVIRKRRIEKKECKVSDEAIIGRFNGT